MVNTKTLKPANNTSNKVQKVTRKLSVKIEVGESSVNKQEVKRNVGSSQNCCQSSDLLVVQVLEQVHSCVVPVRDVGALGRLYELGTYHGRDLI